MGSLYHKNNATLNGGVFALEAGDIEVIASKFLDNRAENIGGVLFTVYDLYQMQLHSKVANFTATKQ